MSSGILLSKQKGKEYRMLHDLRYRLNCLLRRRATEDNLDAELRFHMEQQKNKLTAAGLSPADASREARLLLGGLEQTKEECRDARGLRWWDEFTQNVRYACRSLAQILVYPFG